MRTPEFEQRKKQVAALLKANPELTNEQLGSKLGVNERSIRRYKAAIKYDATEHQEETLLSTRYKRAYTEEKAKCAQLVQALELKDAELCKLADLKKCPKTTPIKAVRAAKREVVPVIVASDWHIEETVTAAITNGLNEYNLEIAEDSIKQFFSNACSLVNITKRDSEVNTIVLAVLGDIINGVLRNEDLENNQVTSIDAMAMARSFLYSGIKLLASETGCRIKVLCCVGNHGRLTEKIHYSNQVHNNLEYLLYKTLERDFKDHATVDFVVAESPYIIQSIFGVRVRFQHGHTIRFMGGIGGMAVPILRKVAQLNQIEKADLDVIGHFHSMQCLNNVIVNGSLVGTNGFSMALGLPHEPPQQTFFLIDSKYGRSMLTPIFIDRQTTQPAIEDI